MCASLIHMFTSLFMKSIPIRLTMVLSYSILVIIFQMVPIRLIPSLGYQCVFYFHKSPVAQSLWDSLPEPLKHWEVNIMDLRIMLKLE